jgi:Glycosyl hydrolases family 28
MSGPVEVEVRRAAGTMRSARVRPLSFGVTPVIDTDGKSARFVLPRPLNVSFEVDGDILHNVHVFASPIEADAPAPGPRVIFFGPGRHAIEGDHVLRVPSDTTVYLAGGAVVEGSIRIVKARNVVIRGRGIIDPSRFFAPLTGATLLVDRSTNVGIRDVTLLRAQDGSITVANSSRLVVAGVREITTDASSDGIFITASRDVVVDDVFLRTSDDSIAVYATTPWYGKGGTRNVTVRNSTLWADVAHAFIAGTHGDPGGRDVIEDVAVHNVDILEHDVRGGGLYEGALALNAGNRVTVRDARFDDVRIEDFSRGQVVNLKVFRNRYYNTRAGLGIEDVLFRRVRYTGTGDNPSRIRGYTASRRVSEVTFENFVRNGTTVLDPADGNVVVGPHTSSVVYRTQPPTRVVDDTSTTLRYSGRWVRREDAASTAGGVRRPAATGSAVAHVFLGRQARIFGSTGPNAGKADVYLDGAYAATVDTYSTIPRAQQIWFDTGVLRRGRHRIELRFKSTRNVLARGSGIAFDKLEIVA